jgi:myo-inositol-1(or 4)-monophosphatase
LEALALTQLTDFQEVSDRAARSAGQVLLDWAGRFQVREKGRADLVTEADLASQEMIRKIILSAFPKHGFLGEEGGGKPSEDHGYRWIVDPLDGTTNYVHGIPNYSVSIALEQAGKLIAGTVFDPVAGECFSATTGHGAFLNGRKISVSSVARLDRAVVAISFPPGVNRESPEIEEFLRLVVQAQSMRRFGSSALNLCYLAAGRFDAYWSSSAKIWDVAAGLLLVAEAGGVVRNRQGGPFAVDPPHFVAASTSELYRELAAALAADSP